MLNCICKTFGDFCLAFKLFSLNLFFFRWKRKFVLLQINPRMPFECLPAGRVLGDLKGSRAGHHMEHFREAQTERKEDCCFPEAKQWSGNLRILTRMSLISFCMTFSCKNKSLSSTWMSAPYWSNGRIKELLNSGRDLEFQSRNKDYCPTFTIAEPQWGRSEEQFLRWRSTDVKSKGLKELSVWQNKLARKSIQYYIGCISFGCTR